MIKFLELIKIKQYILFIFDFPYFPIDIYDYLIDLSFQTGTYYDSLEPIYIIFNREEF